MRSAVPESTFEAKAAAKLGEWHFRFGPTAEVSVAPLTHHGKRTNLSASAIRSYRNHTLAAISIRDIFLIEKLDIGFERGFTVLSGETSRASPPHSIAGPGVRSSGRSQECHYLRRTT